MGCNEPRYIMSKYHPEYLDDRGRKWCIVKQVTYSSHDEVAYVDVLWYDRLGIAIGYENIPTEWLALKDEGQTSGTCISLW